MNNRTRQRRRALRTYESCERRVRLKKEEARRAGGDNKNGKPEKADTNPQLAMILQRGPLYECKLHVPYELLMKIFHQVVEISDHPIRDLCNIANVCEAWRIVILQSPSLWSRINFNELPLTDGNLRVLRRIFDNLPTINTHVREVSLSGPLHFKSAKSMEFLEQLITTPNLTDLSVNRLDPQCQASKLSQLVRAITKSHQIKRLSIKNTKHLFPNQKWLVDFIIDQRGEHLEELHLTSSLRAVTPQLIRSLAYGHCPSLRVLDLSTCDYLRNQTFDAVAIAQTLPNLIILRVANVSFRRVLISPEVHKLTNLEELSMPINMRDADRDDALFATLAYGSIRVNSLDLRGSSISAHALIDMPSLHMRELHIDDLSPLTRGFYGDFIARWQPSLEVVSLVKINCSETIKQCLHALIGDEGESYIKELDLESSDVTEEDLRWFLSVARSLRVINLSSCRSLPRGCKGRYSNNSYSDYNQSLESLKRRLKAVETHSESETEIDEEASWDSVGECLPRKRRRLASKRIPDYVY